MGVVLNEIKSTLRERVECMGLIIHLTTYSLPDVRHNIAGDRDLTETRNQMTINGRRYTIRCLLEFHGDTDLLACELDDNPYA
jgi:hypothetical protein